MVLGGGRFHFSAQVVQPVVLSPPRSVTLSARWAVSGGGAAGHNNNNNNNDAWASGAVRVAPFVACWL